MTTATLLDIADIQRHPLTDEAFRAECRDTLAHTGALVLSGFLRTDAIAAIGREGDDNEHLAFYSKQTHNVYLAPPDADYADDHPRNRPIVSSKGCITDDIVSASSPLRVLYDAPTFREFLCIVLDETSLHAYADPLSSINLHYAKPGQELGWHFDNSAFAITLMIRPPDRGGAFEYVGAVRDADRREWSFEAVARVLDREVEPDLLAMDAGSLVLFRGRNTIHRVAPVQGNTTRMLAVLAYNAEPGVSLSPSARMTFYGRLE